MKYKKYLKFKDSEVDWLGEIPSAWEARRLGFYFTERREKVSDKDFNALSVTKNGIVPQLDNAAKTDDGDNRKKVCSGDFVINSRSDRKGSSGLSKLTGSVSLINTVIQPKNINGEFSHYLFRSYPFQEEFYRYGKGIVADLWSTNYTSMKNITIPYPPIQEQQQIAKFLDNATQKMDTLIQKQENLIKLLKEKRQAVISHAVTRGLNPDVKFKDSGVEWLGDVPEHWKVLKLSYAFNTIGSGTTPTSNNESYYNGNIPWVTTGELRENTIIHTKKMLTNKAIVENTSLKLFPEDSIIIAMYGATIGRLAKLGIKATTNQACCVINNSRTIINNYLYYWLMGYRQEIINLGYGGGQPNISQDTISNLKISVTSIPEQKEIVKYLDDKTSKIDKLIKKATKSIKLLKEKRTALISAAVTGKVDVREIV